jgi:hypothetical protein
MVTHCLDFSAILSATQRTKASIAQIRGDSLTTTHHRDPMVRDGLFALRAHPFGGALRAFSAVAAR